MMNYNTFHNIYLIVLLISGKSVSYDRLGYAKLQQIMSDYAKPVMGYRRLCLVKQAMIGYNRL